MYGLLLNSSAGGVLSDQAEADEDTSLKNRALIAIGKICNLLGHELNVSVRQLFKFELTAQKVVFPVPWRNPSLSTPLK